MKLVSLSIILLSSMMIVSCHLRSIYGMDGMDRIDIKFQKQAILVQDLQSKVLIQAVKSFSAQGGDTYSLSKRIVNGEEIWVEPLEDGRYTNPFKKAEVSIQTLGENRDLKSLKAVVGEPYFREGPLDNAGAVIYKWRVIDPTRKTPPTAVEITVVLGQPGGPLVYMVLTQFVKIQS